MRAGRVTEAEARNHPYRNRLLRCLGKDGEVGQNMTLHAEATRAREIGVSRN